MDSNKSPTLCLRARGPLACFTRPEFKVERLSYPVMTPSAARGLIEAVLWKPAIHWHIERIHVLAEIRFTTFRRNEVSKKIVAPKKNEIEQGAERKPYFIEDDRAQRNTVALRDVDYLIHAHFTLTNRAGPADNVNKFVDMFQRRVAKGQHFHQPYFGCREFVAEVLPEDPAPPPVDDTRDLGLMLWDIDFGEERNTPVFFHAQLKSGILDIPINPQPEPVLLATGGDVP